MSDRDSTRLWLCMQDSGRTRTLSRALAKNTGMTVFMGPVSENDGEIAFIIADDAHAGRIAEARRQAAPNQKALLVTGGAKQLAKADLYMLHDTDAGTLYNAIDGLRAYRDYEIALGRAADLRVGAIKSLGSGEFLVRTAEEARDVAIFIAQGCPRTCNIAVGIYVLLVNAIEHGNLEFSPDEKAESIAEGRWRRKVARRIGEAAYAKRRVHVKFKRGGRMISLVIQDEGPGIDLIDAERKAPSPASYRGKGIKLARSLGFCQVSYLGVGSTVEASIMLAQDDKEPAVGRRMTG